MAVSRKVQKVTAIVRAERFGSRTQRVQAASPAVEEDQGLFVGRLVRRPQYDRMQITMRHGQQGLQEAGVAGGRGWHESRAGRRCSEPPGPR